MKYALIASLLLFLAACAGPDKNAAAEGTKEVYEFYGDGTVKSIGNFKDGKHPEKHAAFQLYELCTPGEFMPAIDSMGVSLLLNHLQIDDIGWCSEFDKTKIDKRLAAWKTKFPQILFLWSKADNTSRDARYELLALRVPDADAQVINSNDIARTSVGLDQVSGQITVDIALTEDGGGEFATMSAQNIGKRVAIVSNGVVMSAPNMISVVSGGTVQITGNFMQEEAEKMKRAIDPYILNGERRSYYPNGKLKEIRIFKDGESTGEWKKYNENGELTEAFGRK